MKVRFTTSVALPGETIDEGEVRDIRPELAHEYRRCGWVEVLEPESTALRPPAETTAQRRARERVSHG